MKFIFILFVFLLNSTLAFSKSKITQCNATQIKLKNCFLKYGVFSLRFSKDKIIYNDGVRRTLHDFPDGTSPDWKSIEVKKVGPRRVFLEIKTWTTPKTQANVQDLLWNVIELKRGAFEQKLNYSIQKKRSSTIDGKPANISDPMLYHELKALPSDQVRWYVGRKSDLI